MIIYIEKSKEVTKQLLGIVSECNQIPWYKVKIKKKNNCFVYVSRNQLENGI